MLIRYVTNLRENFFLLKEDGNVFYIGLDESFSTSNPKSTFDMMLNESLLMEFYD